MQAKYLKVVLIVLLGWSQVVSAESFNGWYQVDVIVFKPARTDLDAESWPVFEPSYPANVIAVTEPRVFNLTQLEQAEPIAGETIEAPLQPTLSRDEFLFQDEGFSDRNRRLLESMTRPAGEPADEIEEVEEAALQDSNESIDGITDDRIDSETTESTIALPRELPDADPFGHGTLAYRRTTDDSTLNGILRSLNFSSRFKVMSHDSWLQPINAEPTPVMVQTGQRYDDRFEIEGTLSFSRSRYLHVQTDLWYTTFEERLGGASPYLGPIQTELSDEVLKEYADLVEVERQRGQYFPARVHRMMQSRRMRSSELHYLDHPLFGVIVQISRFEPDIPEDIAGTEAN